MKAKDWIKWGQKFPYEIEDPEHEDCAPKDWAHAAARGILSELCDRAGIKHELRAVDDFMTRREIVENMAEIIRSAAQSSAKPA